MKARMPSYSIDSFDGEMAGVGIQQEMKERMLLEETGKPKHEFSCSYSNGHIMTSSPQMLRIIDICRRVAATDVPVLILGESGAGKEVLAHFIHDQSSRFGNAFVKVNCAALPQELLESELFGYEKGAFTRALRDKPGKFEQADRGTLFLDEIAEMSPHIQAKLLHVLQDGELSRLGSKRPAKVDVRVLAATNRKLKDALLKGEFRRDLYFRLNVIEIEIPPLRDRPADIALLANFFFAKYRERYANSKVCIPEALMKSFKEYEWPGNVRELENVVKRYLILNDVEMRNELDIGATAIGADPIDTSDLKIVGLRAADQAQRGIVLRVLRETGWNRKECAKRLHISYKGLRNKLKKWDLKRPV